MISPAQSPLVRSESLGVRFGKVDVLHDVDLEVGRGAHLVLMGRSGSGKSTLLLTLAGLLTPTAGAITWPGLAEDARLRRAEIGMVFQAPSLMAELTALQNVTLPLRLRGVGQADARTQSLSALGEVGAADLGEAFPAQLSGGQQQRIAIARVLAGRHRLVLADEPTGSLDRAHAHEVALALRDGVAATGGAIVVATHDPELAAMFDQQLAIVDGELTSERVA